MDQHLPWNDLRAGLGAAVLPCYLGDHDPSLVRQGEPVPALASELCLLPHPELRKAARATSDQQDTLAGRCL